ncbi:hypothetical protein [Haloechinothrix sp. LS1_15]|uniref:hypothetical protein n=1 Tax=Haloechinothrix sp. LS1_15 TaxID=2652248 RepID=UPI002946C265|nr:hypothetical protein [Haloechinothrix sp. LS1_15]MDV6012342.1 hypothetical protein [Haloechinothrix sp. LS1_15]
MDEERTSNYSNLPLTFKLQSGFLPINFSLDTETRANQLIDALRTTVPNLTNEEVLHVVMVNQYMVEHIISEGIIFAANFVGRSRQDFTSATTAQFTVSTREAHLRSTRPLDTVAAEMRKHSSKPVLDFVDLPIGQCLTVVSENTYTMPRRITGQQEPTTRTTRQIQVTIPILGHDKIAVFTLSTEFLRDWQDYVDMMAEICSTIAWQDHSSGTIGSILDGLN